MGKRRDSIHRIVVRISRIAPAIMLAMGVLLAQYVPARATPSSARSAAGQMVPPAPAWKAQASGTVQPLYAVSCFGALRCKAVGAHGTVLYTRDAGRTWRAQRNPLTGSSTILYRIAC